MDLLRYFVLRRIVNLMFLIEASIHFIKKSVAEWDRKSDDVIQSAESGS